MHDECGEDMQLQDLKCKISNLQTHFTRTDFTQFTAVSLAANWCRGDHCVYNTFTLNFQHISYFEPYIRGMKNNCW